MDLGLATFAVLSDGTKISAPKFLRRAERKLKRAQQAHSRKQKGSRNKDRSRARLARMHARVASKRADFQHKASTQIIRESQAVYVEDMCVAGLVRARLAKRIHDAGWSGFVRMLDYKKQEATEVPHDAARAESPALRAGARQSDGTQGGTDERTAARIRRDRRAGPGGRHI